jgi:hypothetical protein
LVQFPVSFKNNNDKKSSEWWGGGVGWKGLVKGHMSFLEFKLRFSGFEFISFSHHSSEGGKMGQKCREERWLRKDVDAGSWLLPGNCREVLGIF